FSSVSFDTLDSPPTIYIFLEDRLLPSTLNISASISDGSESFFHHLIKKVILICTYLLHLQS
ncbi:hypothetical protein ACTPEF_26055, partial [Clostridioides difficile]